MNKDKKTLHREVCVLNYTNKSSRLYVERTEIMGIEELYEDRKMIKWMGFFLSEHNEQLSAEKKKPVIIEPKEEQSIEEITKLLKMMWEKRLVCSIQLNFIENGSYYPDIVGTIEGFTDELIIVQTEEGIRSFSESAIRNVQENERIKWFK